MMADNEMFEGFDYEKMLKDQKKYEQEVKDRWGDTKAYAESKERTNKYTKEDWEQINAEAEENLRDLIDCFNEGLLPADDPRVRAICERAHAHIDRYYYSCPVDMFACLGKWYVADERFTEYYDKHAKGLAAYYNQAIQSYCNASR